MSNPRETENESMIQKDESFGIRFNYAKSQYRDAWCAVTYIIHLIIMVAVTAYLASLAADDVNTNSNEANEETEEIEFTGAIVVVISCAIVGLVLGFIWLTILKRYALQIIKMMLYLNICLWIVLVIVGIVSTQFVLAIVAAIFVVFWVLYMWCMRERIRFASVLLSLSSRIVSAFPGTVCVAISMITLTVIWIIVWLVCAGSYMFVTRTETVNPESGETEYGTSANMFVVFLLFVSLYWVIQVNSNVSHTTSCGVAASWYFTPPQEPMGGTQPAFKRSMTTSFGSICLGSLIVAILQAIRAMIESAQRKRDGGALLLCLLQCCVGCIERCIRWFNKYAFAHCAIYGTSFMTSAGATWRLLSSRGILALINDDLSGMALFAGGLISAVICGLIGAGIAYPFYGDTSSGSDMIVALAVYGAISGFVLTLLVLSAVRSAIVCLFVCFAEEPAVLYENRRGDFDELAGVKPEFQTVYDNWGITSV